MSEAVLHVKPRMLTFLQKTISMKPCGMKQLNKQECILWDIEIGAEWYTLCIYLQFWYWYFSCASM